MKTPPAALAIARPGSRILHSEKGRATVEEEVRGAVFDRTRAELEWTGGDRETVRAALDAAIARGAPLVVVIGGDGTIRLAAERLVGTGIPLAIVPGGTGNLFSGALGLPVGRSSAIRAVAEGDERAVDAGSVSWSLHEATDDRVPATGSGIFVVACGSGFDANVMAAADEGAKQSVGRAAYFAAAASLVPGLTAHRHRIDIDGEVHEVDALAVLVVNAGELIPGLVAPRLPITSNDGLLDVLVVKASGVIGGVVGGLELLARTQVGWSATGSSLRVRGRHVEVSSDPPDTIEVDGDVLGRGSFVADILPDALIVVHPTKRGH